MSNENTLSLSGQAQLCAALIKALPRDIHPEVSREWEKNGKELTRRLSKMLRLPPQFEYNGHGHIMFTICGVDLTGEQEINRLKTGGFRLHEWTESCFLSEKAGCYDDGHHLEDGRQYKVVLIPMTEIKTDLNRSVHYMRKYAVSMYGYEVPPAGLAPRIREAVSDNLMQVMGFFHITPGHEPVRDIGGTMQMLQVVRGNKGRNSIETDIDREGVPWGDKVAIAFIVPEG